MDAVQRAVLIAEIKDHLDKSEQIYVKLLLRTQQVGSPEPAFVESAAFQLHNLYGSVEDLLKIVASAFENSIADFSRWHSELLNRMTLEIVGVRPAFLSPESAALLHELRAFRHFFRHAYSADLDENRVMQNVAVALKLRELLKHDAHAFIKAIDSPKPA